MSEVAEQREAMYILSVLNQCSGLTFPRRAGPITCLLHSDTSERGRDHPHMPLATNGRQENYPEVIREGDLVLAQHSGGKSYTSPGQHSRAGLDVGIVGEPGSKGVNGRASPASCLLGIAWMRGKYPHPLPCKAGRRARSGVMRMGKSALYLTWAAE